MKTLRKAITEYGVRKLASDIGADPASVCRWAQANKAPRWWVPWLKQLVGEFSMARK